ncbi:MAG: bifunctional phosphoribosylaminoimidazolecarboxamide formyltransferase/IMP cyclohydrolase [Deltaproteobacteria bacterium]|nr:bifunctional phosphoribosylaminoimidazolecarboxamide formyltransferase/IMP cyclohydrolase [Deltaproteobacteria bacterium]
MSTTTGLITIRRALVSVSDKAYLEDLGRALVSAGAEILATGRTAAALKRAGIAYTPVDQFTGNPEAFDGRMKTISFRLESAILYDRASSKHVEEARRLEIPPIDCVVCNFYPFEEALEKLSAENPGGQAGASLAGQIRDQLVDQVDIGGPTMVRAAAKNFAGVLVLTDPADYPGVIAELRQKSGSVSYETRRKMMLKAFERVLDYDRAIYEGFARQPLRYGENPHQRAYFIPSSGAGGFDWDLAALSYNNILDANAAFGAVCDARETLAHDMRERHHVAGAARGACAIVKHNNPCGLATGATIAEAFDRAWAGDPVSSFGAVVALSAPLTSECARLFKKKFIEVLIAPGFEEGVLEELKSSKSKLRIVRAPVGANESFIRTAVRGGTLAQQPDGCMHDELQSATAIAFPKNLHAVARFGIIAAKWIKSNAVAIVRESAGGGFQLVGMGSGQPNRVDAIRRLAIPKAREALARDLREREALACDLSECVLVSDGFFPFADSIEAAAESGIKFVVQPGGSVRDAEVIAACDRLGVAMALTGKRHFRH